MRELVRDMLAVGQKFLPFPEFQQKVQGYFTQFYAEAQQTAQRAAENATKLAVADVNLASLKAEIAQNESASAAKFLAPRREDHPAGGPVWGRTGYVEKPAKSGSTNPCNLAKGERR